MSNFSIARHNHIILVLNSIRSIEVCQSSCHKGGDVCSWRGTRGVKKTKQQQQKRVFMSPFSSHHSRALFFFSSSGSEFWILLSIPLPSLLMSVLLFFKSNVANSVLSWVSLIIDFV